MSHNAFQKMEKVEKEVIRCGDCGCTHFEQIQVNRYPVDHNVIVGQRVPVAEEIDFFVLRCVRCNGIQEPRVSTGPRDLAARLYDVFLDEMDEMKDVVKPEKL